MIDGTVAEDDVNSRACGLNTSLITVARSSTRNTQRSKEYMGSMIDC